MSIARICVYVCVCVSFYTTVCSTVNINIHNVFVLHVFNTLYVIKLFRFLLLCSMLILIRLRHNIKAH